MKLIHIGRKTHLKFFNTVFKFTLGDMSNITILNCLMERILNTVG